MNAGDGQPHGPHLPGNVGVVGGNYDGRRRPRPASRPSRETSRTPNFAVNLPATTGTGQGGAIGLTLGSSAAT
jgi:type IV pilus assembly protein PilQ